MEFFRDSENLWWVIGFESNIIGFSVGMNLRPLGTLSYQPERSNWNNMHDHPLLSDQARRAIRLLGLTPIVDVKICSKCGLSSEQLPKGPHPLLAKIIQARRLLERDRRNVMLSKQLNTLVSQMHHSSRCCQARLKTVQKDTYQPLWETWLEREERVPDLAIIKFTTDPSQAVSQKHRQQFRQKLQIVKPGIRPGPEIPLMAAERPGRPQKHPDFLRMAYLLCQRGAITQGLVKIFRAEEARMAQAGLVREACQEQIAVAG